MFKFDFNVSEKDLDDKNQFTNKNSAYLNDTNEKTLLECYDSNEILPVDDLLENLDVYKVNSMKIKAGDVNIRYIKSGYLLQTFDNEARDTNDITKAEQSHSDLIPGVYEGGAKIWECTDDLISYMSTHYPPDKLKNKRVLDLGCGSGVLGIYAYTCGAITHFQDYNQDVIEKITIPNVALNVPDHKLLSNFDNVKFYSGDWSKYTELTKDDEGFDIILTSETIYNPDNQQKLLNAIDAKLKNDGIVLLAAKIYYFGVGGGLREFEGLIEKDERFSTRILWSSAKGLSREIIELKRIRK